MSKPNGIKKSMPQLYNSWRGMMDRCRSKTRADAHCYALKGIAVCAEWHDVCVFRDWAVANGFAPGMTIERLDSDKSYRPDNCKWATRKEQARHISRNRVIEFNGDSLCLSEWAERAGISPGLLCARIGRLGWKLDKALSIPAGIIRPGSKARDGNDYRIV